MYPSDLPTPTEPPSTRLLLRSTAIAVAAASAILVAIVLPVEHGIDPTGVGEKLGLTEIGEIKAQLAREAAAGKTAAPAAVAAELAVAEAGWEHEMRLALEPGEEAAVKLRMRAGEQAEFSWQAEGGAVHFDARGLGHGRTVRYEKGRNVPADDGVLEAAFDGHHGWLWRNRGESEVTVVIRARGDYAEMRRLL